MTHIASLLLYHRIHLFHERNARKIRACSKQGLGKIGRAFDPLRRKKGGKKTERTVKRRERERGEKKNKGEEIYSWSRRFSAMSAVAGGFQADNAKRGHRSHCTALPSGGPRHFATIHALLTFAAFPSTRESATGTAYFLHGPKSTLIQFRGSVEGKYQRIPTCSYKPPTVHCSERSLVWLM